METNSRTGYAGNVRLAYWVARRVVMRRRPEWDADRVEDIAQAGVIEGWRRWESLNCNACEKDSPRNCLACVRLCVTRGTLSALRAKKCFGNPSSDVAVRDDLYNRVPRAGCDADIAEHTGSVGKIEVPEEPSPAEDRKQVESEALRNGLTPRQVQIAGLRHIGIGREEVGMILGVTSRTIDNELAEMRQVLG